MRDQKLYQIISTVRKKKRKKKKNTTTHKISKDFKVLNIPG